MTGTARLASREGTAAGPSLAAALTSSSILTNQHPQASHVLTKSECQRVFWSCCAIWQPQGEKVSSHFHLLFPACQEVESFLFLAIEVLWLWCTCSHPSPTRPLSCCFSVYIDWIQSFCWMYCKQSPGVSFLFFFCLWQTSVPAEARQATHASEAGFLRLAAPAGHQPIATTCQDGSQCARSSDFFFWRCWCWKFEFLWRKFWAFCLFVFSSFFSVLRQGLRQPRLTLNSLCSWE